VGIRACGLLAMRDGTFRFVIHCAALLQLFRAGQLAWAAGQGNSILFACGQTCAIDQVGLRARTWVHSDPFHDYHFATVSVELALIKLIILI
jgi:hypothetical protein